MSQANLYDEKIKWIERELRNLKTAHFKTATTINTMTNVLSLSFSLIISDEYTICSSQRAIITLTTEDDTDMISACYLSGVTPSNLNQRFPFVKRIASGNGEAKYEVSVFSQNPDDYTTISGGGTVNLDYNVQLVGSSRFTSSVNYRPILGGSS